MTSKSDSKIYDNEKFFAPYLKATDEKLKFVNYFAEHISQNTKCESLVDVGCFNGSLTIALVAKLLMTGRQVKAVTGVEPSLIPLQSFESAPKPEGITWNFEHATAEEFADHLTHPSFDWLIASHSLYWSGANLESLLQKFHRGSQKRVIIIRDEGFLHQFEMSHRPKIAQGKQFVSSAEVTAALSNIGVKYSLRKLNSKMSIPSRDSSEFKHLIGFLLDLTERQLSPALMRDVSAELAGQSEINAGIDIIWW